jgi:hypothetical protein
MRDEDRARAALQNFIAELNNAWEAAGPPSYSRLEKLSEQFGTSEPARGLRVRVLAASTTHDILTGKRRSLPEWGWVVSFVSVLRIAAVENALDPEVVGTVAEWKIRHQTARATMREAQSDPDPPRMRVHRVHPGKERRKRRPPKPPPRPALVRCPLTSTAPFRRDHAINAALIA